MIHGSEDYDAIRIAAEALRLQRERCLSDPPPAREVGITTAQPKALPLVTPVPWFPGRS
jgi:hypothetical protein